MRIMDRLIGRLAVRIADELEERQRPPVVVNYTNQLSPNAAAATDDMVRWTAAQARHTNR